MSLTISHLNEMLQGANKEIQNYHTFIESGTNEGNTIFNIYSAFNTIITVELSSELFTKFTDRLRLMSLNKVEAYLGETHVLLPHILSTLPPEEKAIFFLDGHYSSGNTARGSIDTPILEECRVINDYYSGNETLVIIDDVRLFATYNNEDWTKITQNSIMECFKDFQISTSFIYHDQFILSLERAIS